MIRRAFVLTGAIIGGLVVVGCSHVQVAPRDACADRRIERLADVPDHFDAVDTWTSALPAGEADRVLMDRRDIAALNARNAATNLGFRDVLGDAVVDRADVLGDLRERVEWLRRRIGDGSFREAQPGSFEQAVTRMFAAADTDEVAIVHTETTLYCVPMTAGLYTVPVDTDFDRNRCTGLHPGEVVRIVRRHSPEWLYIHAGHSVGWLPARVLTPPVSREAARRFRDAGPRAVATADAGWLRMGMSFPLLEREPDGWRLQVPAPDGLVERRFDADAPLNSGFLPFTRRNVWRLALAQVGRAYGWGGRAGERDCSRLIMDVFAAFGLRLGRHSGYQSQNGVMTVGLRTGTDLERHDAVRQAGLNGVVLLYMPGHIMLYLGERDGRSWAVSSLSEYLVPCGAAHQAARQAAHQVVRLDKVAVSDLELGRGTERTAFLERLRRLAVFGPAP